jgi:hypothetical protein
VGFSGSQTDPMDGSAFIAPRQDKVLKHARFFEKLKNEVEFSRIRSNLLEPPKENQCRWAGIKDQKLGAMGSMGSMGGDPAGVRGSTAALNMPFVGFTFVCTVNFFGLKLA